MIGAIFLTYEASRAKILRPLFFSRGSFQLACWALFAMRNLSELFEGTTTDIGVFSCDLPPQINTDQFVL